MATQGKRIVFNTAFILNIIGYILLFVAFASPYWFVSWPRVYSPFKKIGLWEACFAGLVRPVDPNQKAYHGCWWILAPEFYDIRKWAMPYWFIICQIVTTLCFLFGIINLIIMLYIWMVTDSDTNSGTGKRSPSICLLQTSTVITVITAIAMTGVCLLFGIEAYYDHYWMPHPELNYLSWSYGLAIVSTFFSIFASVAIIIYTKIERQELREPRTPGMPVGFQVKDSSI